MADVSIRKYRNSDYDVVHSMFVEGMMEHLPASYSYLLKLPQLHLTVSLLLLVIFLATGSYLLTLATLALLLAGGWYEMKFEFCQYVSQSQKGDLLDIQTTYMMRSNSCFWVAESEGKVVGMVAAQPSEESEDEMVLKRLCVGRDHRRKGIAKALCLKVIGFAKECGYKAVCLETDIIQYSAQKLYQRIGFQKYRLEVHQGLFGKCPTFLSLYYKYTVTNS
uniref:N-acetyltransferase 8 gene 5 n=1 Tax=Xenopus tropicalis TaxID=8364 RepID=A0A803J260_XENTR